MHTLSIFSDIFGEMNERTDLLSRSMEMIGEEGNGVIVVINRPMQG
jgi:3,4-dihydroxy 2-butanone 4-phosphate synthase/GTP cyclohydrolase II